MKMFYTDSNYVGGEKYAGYFNRLQKKASKSG